MEAKIWFILSEGQVTGPYDNTEAETRLNSAKDPQIWGRGQTEWMTASRWRQVMKDSAIADKQKPTKDETVWKVKIEGQEKAPLKYPDLIAFLKKITDFSSVDICPENSTVWKEIYAYPQLADELGISRRSHPRVPIVGRLVCESPKGDFTYRVISISEGGLGINDAKELKIGDRFKATLTSPNLFVTINSVCEVVYIGNEGFAGLRFVGLPTEFKSSIIEYVNKFATA